MADAKNARPRDETGDETDGRGAQKQRVLLASTDLEDTLSPDTEPGSGAIATPGVGDGEGVLANLGSACVDLGRDGPEYDAAKHAEWENWRRHDVFEWVRDEGQQAQRTRWILTKKDVGPERDAEGNGAGAFKFKARLCAQGTARQDPQVGVLVSESPTVSRAAIRILLSHAGQRRWELVSFDISCAFLQGSEIDGAPGGNNWLHYGVDKREIGGK